MIKPLLIVDLGTIYPNENSKFKKRFGIFKCACGIEFKAQYDNIKSGHTKSCGCHKIEAIKDRSITHGLSGNKLFLKLMSMISRTENVNNIGFKNYSSLDIRVCDEWKLNPKSFIDWALLNGYKDGLTIDRIDNNLGYSPENCRFVNMYVQARNKRIIMTTNTSGYRGVVFDKINKKWKARIGLDNKNHHIGRYKTKIEAATAYNDYIVANNLEHTQNILTTEVI
jgi:hypothetical protein